MHGNDRKKGHDQLPFLNMLLQQTAKERTVSRTICFTQGLYARLKREAQTHRIPLSLLVRQACAYALDNMEEET
nr:hypothetical protein [Maliibacterium massiliense]